jgi:uncharacterized membrane protein YozB (DUF420 family)
MNNSNKKTLEQRFRLSIIIVSIVIPIAVAILFTVKLKDFGIEVEPLSFLPPIYASINGLTALLLLMGVMAIKNGNKKVHERFMTMAIACSVVFLVMYVAYHMTADSTVYGDIDGNNIYNALIAVKPNNGVCLSCINQIVENVGNRYYKLSRHESALSLSGPLCALAHRAAAFWLAGGRGRQLS